MDELRIAKALPSLLLVDWNGLRTKLFPCPEKAGCRVISICELENAICRRIGQKREPDGEISAAFKNVRIVRLAKDGDSRLSNNCVNSELH